MQKTILLALLLVVWHCAGAQTPQGNQELMNAALRLKQAAVLRTLEDCKAKGGSVKSCNTLLELTHQREVKIIERLKLAPTDPAVNMDEMSKELAACSDPNYGYVETVECWSQLSDRLDASRKGQSLLRGPADILAAAVYSKAPYTTAAACHAHHGQWFPADPTNLVFPTTKPWCLAPGGTVATVADVTIYVVMRMLSGQSGVFGRGSPVVAFPTAYSSDREHRFHAMVNGAWSG